MKAVLSALGGLKPTKTDGVYPGGDREIQRDEYEPNVVPVGIPAVAAGRGGRIG